MFAAGDRKCRVEKSADDARRSRENVIWTGNGSDEVGKPTGREREKERKKEEVERQVGRRVGRGRIKVELFSRSCGHSV